MDVFNRVSQIPKFTFGSQIHLFCISIPRPQDPNVVWWPHSSAAQCVKGGGGAIKMLQTAKTFVTKLVRYIGWIVDPLWGHQFYLIWYCYGQKRPFFGQNRRFWPYEAPDAPYGWQKWIKWWITVEHM